MEYVDGIDFAKLVGKAGPLDGTRAANYVAQAADGLAHAHERNLVHRDIKPSNVLVDRDGVVKVLDMGLARFFDGRAGNLTGRLDGGGVMGTADYIAPEQALDAEVTAKADIYSLGCTFYYLLAGRAPFADANVTQKLLLHQMREPPPPADFRADLEDGLAQVAGWMMAKLPADRPSAAQVVEALRPWLGRPVAPPSAEELPPTPWGDRVERAAGSGTSLVASAGSTAKLRNTVPAGGSAAQEIASAVAVATAEGSAFAFDDDHPPPAAKPVPVAVAADGPRASSPAKRKRTRWIAGGAAAVAAAVVAVVALTRPGTKAPDPDPGPKPPAAVEPFAVGPGFTLVKLDAGSPRPGRGKVGVRTAATDALVVAGPELAAAGDAEALLLHALRGDLVGRGVKVVPYAVGYAPTYAKTPSTFLTVKPDGGLRPLSLKPDDNDYVVVAEHKDINEPPVPLADAADANVLVLHHVVVPPSLTRVNSLNVGMVDIHGSPGGSTLRVASGGVLVWRTSSAGISLSAQGDNPPDLDFNARTGFVTICSEQDFHDRERFPDKREREYVLRSRLVNFGGKPLVLSGLTGNGFRLDNGGNDNPALVVQGLPLLSAAGTFDVSFGDEKALGKPGGPVTLVEAALVYTGNGPAAADRTLTLGGSKASVLRVPDGGGVLRWDGRAVGPGQLVKDGAGTVVFTNKVNDFTGGTDVVGGRLDLHGDNGTPAGRGPVRVGTGAALSGSGRIDGPLTVAAGGTLQPGTVGKPLTTRGTAALAAGSKLAVAAAANGRLLVIDGAEQRTKLDGVNLEWRPADGQALTAGDKCFVIVSSHGPCSGTFAGLPEGAEAASADGKWVAKVGYRGSAAKGTPAGGNDVVLYDFRAK